MNELARSTHAASPRTGVLLINLGTPDAPTAPAIRRYLAQFLSDRRVVEIPRLVWLPILYLFVLTLRPKRLVHAYGSVWTHEGSPLMAISKRQAAALREHLRTISTSEIPVALSMTYGSPGIPQAIAELEAQGVRRLVVLPLYPQYSCSTTAAAFDALFDELRKRRWLPELRTIGSYHDHPSYIAALANSVLRHWQANGRGDHLLISFHGIPQQYVTAGDPYYCHCQKTARLLAEKLELNAADYTVTFQSRFGKATWLQPYTDTVVKQLAQRGVKTLDAVCPGFPADCLETLEEVTLRYGADFVAAGGTALRYIAALNEHPEHIEALAGILAPLLSGDPIENESPDAPATRAARAAALEPVFSGSAT